MTFANEMKDFFAAFRTTASVASDIRDRRDRRKKDNEDKELFEGFASSYEGPSALPTDSFGPGADEDTDTEKSADDENVVVPDTMPEEDPEKAREKKYASMGFAAGGKVPKFKIGTQKGRLPVDMSKMNKDLLARWEKTQKDFGREFNIVSAYRSPKRNKKAGGAKRSQHMHGNAIDIDVSGLSKPERLNLIKTASANGLTGIGVYNNSLHFDVGGRRAWGPDYSSKSLPGWAKGTIDQHMAGKFGDYKLPTTPAREPEYETASALPVDSPTAPAAPTEQPTEQPSEGGWRERLRQMQEESSGGGYADYGIPEEDTSQGNDALASFYDNEGIDISALDVPEPRPYAPGDLSGSPKPTLYAAGGGTVPWAGQTSYVRRRPGGYGTGFFQRRPYVPRNSNPSLPLPGTATKPKTTGKNPWNNDAMDYIINYSHIYSPDYVRWVQKSGMDKGGGGFAWSPVGPMMYSWFGGDGKGVKFIADGGVVGGAVEDEPEEEQAIHEEEIEATTPRRALPLAGEDKNAPMMPKRPAGRQRAHVSLPQALDLGLKHLTGALGLDQPSTAVGRDENMSIRRKALINGVIAPGEPPPNPQEMQAIFKVVDPKGELNDSLRTIHALRKGVEFYLGRGEVDKAAKWSAGLIQFSNLVSRQYGVQAVRAAKAGDMEGMVRLAVMSYDAIPDGRNVSAQFEGGNIINVTRTDEEGNVVDTHRLTPQQVFQMATGISQGSGYFEALMDVASPGTSAAAYKEKRASIRAANLGKLLPDLKQDMSAGEVEAWKGAVEDGDYDTLNKILTLVGQRRTERLRDERYDERQADIDRRIEEARKATTEDMEKRFAHTEEMIDKRAADTEARETKRETDRKTREEEDRKREVESLVVLYDEYAPLMSEAQRAKWDEAVAANNPKALERILDKIDADEKAKKAEENLNKRLEHADKSLDKRLSSYEERIAQRDAIRDQNAKDDAAAREARDKATRDAQAAKDAAKEQAIKDRRATQVKVLNNMLTDLEAKMSEGDKAAWRAAAEAGEPDIIKSIIQKYNKSDDIMSMMEEINALGAPEEEGGLWDTVMGWFGFGEEEAIPSTPAPVTPQSNSLRPMPPEVKAKAMQAIREGRSRAGVVDKLRKQGYDPAGL